MNPVTFKHRRLALDLSQQQLAEHVGLTASQLDLAEREELSRDVTFLLNLALSLLEENYEQPLEAVAV